MSTHGPANPYSPKEHRSPQQRGSRDTSVAVQPRSTRVLVSGFGPFPGVPDNPSADLAAWLAQRALDKDTRSSSVPIDVACVLLPTSWNRAAEHWSAAIRDLKPDVAVSFGVSRRASGFVIECLARNIAHGCDVDGEHPSHQSLAHGAPRYRRSRLPGRALVRTLRTHGLPAQRSLNAGRYLCNAVLYRGLSLVEPSRRPELVGFVHLPALVVPEPERPHRRALTWEQAQTGASAILHCLAERAAR